MKLSRNLEYYKTLNIQYRNINFSRILVSAISVNQELGFYSNNIVVAAFSNEVCHRAEFRCCLNMTKVSRRGTIRVRIPRANGTGGRGGRVGE